MLVRGQVLLVSAAVLALVFTLLTVLVLRADLQPTSWDIGITHEIQELPAVPVGYVLEWVSKPGFQPWNYIIPTMIILFMVLMRWYREAFFTAMAGAGGFLAEIVKNMVDRPRPTPEFARITEQLQTYSFPSGHVTTYTVLFGYLFYLAFVSLPKKSVWRWIIMVVCGALIVLVGPSRVYMGQHWASDAIAGYALGFGYLFIVISVHRWWVARTTPKAE
jgi:membrane-associated phospholipid phosphatase